MKRVLLTGAGGFLGRRCMPELLARGYEVHAVARRGAPPHEAPQREYAPGVRWHAADLLDGKVIEALVAEVEPTHLLHLAWYTEHGKFWTGVENLRWVGASLSLLEAFAEHKGRRVVAAGTCVEYAPVEGAPCSEASTRLAPTTLYGACKHATRTVLEAFARQTGLSHAWGRLFFPYGPGEPPAKLVPSVASALLAGQPALCTHGRQVRDFIYVEDAAAALVELLGTAVSGPVNIASGHGVAIKDLVGTVADIIGRPDLIRLGARPAQPDEPPALIADVQRLRNEVGFQPKHSLESGLRLTVEWLQRTLDKMD